MIDSKKHDGDCSIYSSLLNGRPTDGICTCGYGFECERQCDVSQMYSDEKLDDMKHPDRSIN
jgi:hypothetical protein